MDEVILAGSVVVIGVFLLIFLWWRKRRRERQEKIDLQIERINLANKPGYKPPGDGRMRTTIKDGVVTYRRDMQKKDEK